MIGDIGNNLDDELEDFDDFEENENVLDWGSDWW